MLVSPGKVDPLIHGAGAHARLQAAAVMAAAAIARIGAPETEQRLLVAAAGTIHRNRDGKGARLLRALDHRLRHLPFVGGVELVPDRRAARGDDILDADAGCGREDLQMIAGLGGASGGSLAVVMERALAADRRQHDRRIVFRAEDVDAHIDLAHVDEPPRPELEFQEPLAVGAQGHFVVDAGGHVAEMRRRDVLAADRLEIEDVDRLLGRVDEIFGAHRPPHQRVRKLRSRRGPFAGERRERTAGQQRAAR